MLANKNEETKSKIRNILNNIDDFYMITCDDGKDVLLHIPSLSIYTLDTKNSQLVHLLFQEENGENIDQVLNFILNDDELYQSINELEQLTNYRVVEDLSTVRRLALLISQDCFLDCKYCYANKGLYNKKGYMDKSIISNTLRSFYNTFDNIEAIQAFGGEPLLNLDVIEFLLNELLELSKFPRISIESGLGVPSKYVDHLVEIIQRFGDRFEFEIVASMDGPEEVQNFLRPFKGGASSYEIVSNNLMKLRQIDQPKAIEVTYTKMHQQHGFDYDIIKTFFNDTFGIRNLIIVPVMSSDKGLAFEQPISPEIHRVMKLIWQMKMNENQEVKDELRLYLNRIFQQAPDQYYCRAGITNFVVDINGDIYPCQLVVGNARFKISNVNESPDIVKNSLLDSAEAYKRSNSKLSDEKCRGCFLRYSCGGCVFEKYRVEGYNGACISYGECDLKIEAVKNMLKERIWEGMV